jgi:hypothetical protein
LIIAAYLPSFSSSYSAALYTCCNDIVMTFLIVVSCLADDGEQDFERVSHPIDLLLKSIGIHALIRLFVGMIWAKVKLSVVAFAIFGISYHMMTFYCLL